MAQQQPLRALFRALECRRWAPWSCDRIPDYNVRFFAKKAGKAPPAKGSKAAKAAQARGKKEQIARGKKPVQAKQAAGGAVDAAPVSFEETDGWISRDPEELVDDELFTGTRSIPELTSEDVNKYYYLSENDTKKYFAEGFPKGVVKEFQTARGSFIRMRTPAMELWKKLEYTASITRMTTTCDSDLEASETPEQVRAKNRKHFILDGPIGCGKSFTLTTIVQWARSNGWLVFYVPNAKSWTRGGYYYLNELTRFWDTPLQAQRVLKGFLDSHATMLGGIKCRVGDAIPLGEAAGLGRQPGPQELTIPDGFTLKDLVEKGISMQTAASNIVMRLRQELDLVTEYPVLIAVDEYNSWFNFSEYFQFLDYRKRRHIHSKELGMVHAFRKMYGTPTFFIGAFSQSTNVGKLPLELPNAPRKTRVRIDRFTKDEVRAALDYYYRQKMMHNEPNDQAIDRLFYLTNGNGTEIRKLALLL